MVGKILNHKMLCLGNLGELFGEMGKLMMGWWEIDKSLTENRVNQWVMMMHKTIFKSGF